ncbi:MAG: hypothetical protein JXA03_15220 [Bacteroidales bacterium]|nr:hypothetical protein [Bacteroidales bacterium]
MAKDHHNKYIKLREKFPRFDYKNFNIEVKPGRLKVQYRFTLAGKHEFSPGLIFIFPKKFQFVKPEVVPEIERAVFDLGMIEMLSYWKAACPPEVYVHPFHLSAGEVAWWRNIYYQGLGEFFYRNKIQNNRENFMTMFSGESAPPGIIDFDDAGTTIVPVGGGKDSAVTLEILRKSGLSVIPLMINLSPAGRGITRKAGYQEEDMIRIERKIDPELLLLNKQGFLNGHTPFSAVVAFAGLLSAILTRSGYIALSNESSANEPTDPVTGVNHQFSKTIEFEASFRDYAGSYITGSTEYFSFLRPLNELQIAALFAGYRHYHNVFRSCNAGSKQNLWCGNCPKCLFTWIALSPFMKTEELQTIWGKDLFEDEKLIPLLDELTGKAPVKPFECVGTIDDVCKALSVSINKFNNSGRLPPLLEHFRSHPGYDQEAVAGDAGFLSRFDNNHFLPPQFEEILKGQLNG